MKPCGCDTYFCEHYGRRLQWIPVERITQVVMIVICGFGIVMVLWALNWAPLWGRLYAACMTQQPEANTVAEIIQHRVDCAGAASRAIEKAR